MKFIQEQVYTVRQGRWQDFQGWLRANEAELAKEHPPGVEYLGTYGAIYPGNEPQTCVKTILQMDSYAAQDVLAEAMTKGRFAELLNEVMQFIDMRPEAYSRQTLWKALVDATIMDE